MNKTRRNFSSQFKLEAAQLVVDQNYSVQEATDAMGVGVLRWVSGVGTAIM